MTSTTREQRELEDEMLEREEAKDARILKWARKGAAEKKIYARAYLQAAFDIINEHDKNAWPTDEYRLVAFREILRGMVS